MPYTLLVIGTGCDAPTTAEKGHRKSRKSCSSQVDRLECLRDLEYNVLLNASMTLLQTLPFSWQVTTWGPSCKAGSLIDRRPSERLIDHDFIKKQNSSKRIQYKREILSLGIISPSPSSSSLKRSRSQQSVSRNRTISPSARKSLEAVRYGSYSISGSPQISPSPSQSRSQDVIEIISLADQVSSDTSATQPDGLDAAEFVIAVEKCIDSDSGLVQNCTNVYLNVRKIQILNQQPTVVVAIWVDENLGNGNFTAPLIKAVYGFVYGLLMNPVCAMIVMVSEDSVRAHREERQQARFKNPEKEAMKTTAAERVAAVDPSKAMSPPAQDAKPSMAQILNNPPQRVQSLNLSWPPGLLNGHVEWANHTIIWIDALSLIEESKRRAAGLSTQEDGQVTRFVKELAGGQNLHIKFSLDEDENNI
ncbi:uncharacterized protein PGTG_21143 [Puccinia graminis f. sp. tritici CRL 75-36-700-3]|uniref:Uncharacterized protein n=1 Tax=Puccinia graminis f. sp. tritici (strain CRL 75-36-700-3 / race SCCL) TaxID=418459 RepID=H6QQS4_PUCGT|nr:uncharacterized protein PGTG_21143 [Puccinia graminis f. sp. tritici CRL 75-36-700-3]EHS62822.1 hypothetical protein PGTG_21143 [Puccinia graminis f. sp. tritici CRL 75-36-700-3]